MFGIKTDESPTPSSVKKMILVLLALGILGYDIEKINTAGDGRLDTTHGHIFGFLAFAQNPDGTHSNRLALHDDTHWSRISTRDAVK